MHQHPPVGPLAFSTFHQTDHERRAAATLLSHPVVLNCGSADDFTPLLLAATGELPFAATFAGPGTPGSHLYAATDYAIAHEHRMMNLPNGWHRPACYGNLWSDRHAELRIVARHTFVYSAFTSALDSALAGFERKSPHLLGRLLEVELCVSGHVHGPFFVIFFAEDSRDVIPYLAATQVRLDAAILLKQGGFSSVDPGAAQYGVVPQLLRSHFPSPLPFILGDNQCRQRRVDPDGPSVSGWGWGCVRLRTLEAGGDE